MPKKNQSYYKPQFFDFFKALEKKIRVRTPKEEEKRFEILKKNYLKLTDLKLEKTVAENGWIIKHALRDQLDFPESKLRIYLVTLDTENKSKLIRALLLNDTESLYEILSPYFENALTVLNEDIANRKKLFSLITAHNETNENQFLSRMVMDFIKVLFDKRGEEEKIIPLNVDEIGELLQKAMQKIPDDVIYFSLKYFICNSIHKEGQSKIKNYNYFELQPLTKNKYTGDIQVKDYAVAIEHLSNYSDFVLITIGLLQKYLLNNINISEVEKNNIKQKLNEIRRDYFNVDYHFLKGKIEALLVEHKEILNKLSGNLFETIIRESQRYFKSPDSISRNYTRRFFESRLAQLYLGQKDNPDFNCINKFLFCFHRKAVSTFSIYEIDRAILEIAGLQNQNLVIRWESFRKKNKLYKLKNLNKKPGISARMEELQTGYENDSIFTANPSVMTSLQPYFHGETLKHNIRNKVVDVNYGNEDKYVNEINRLGVFAGSISGHAYFLFAVIEEYIQSSQKEGVSNEVIQADVNSFLRQAGAVFICRGYHGANEMFDLFRKDEKIMEIFEKLNIKIDLSFKDDLLESAFKDSQEYALRLSLKSATQNPDELLAKKDTLKKPKPII